MENNKIKISLDKRVLGCLVKVFKTIVTCMISGIILYMVLDSGVLSDIIYTGISVFEDIYGDLGEYYAAICLCWPIIKISKMIVRKLFRDLSK